MSKIALCLGVLLLLGFIVVQARRPLQPTTKLRIQKGDSHKIVDPTVIDDAELTGRQKEHSRLFKGFDKFNDGRKLKDMATTQDVHLGIPPGSYLKDPNPDVTAYLQKKVCEADAVVIGDVTAKEAQIIEEGTFVFTDYTINVDQIIKDNPKASLTANSPIIVSRIGGAVLYHNHLIETIHSEELPLRVGRKYVLFLSYVHKTGAYTNVRKDYDYTLFFLNDKLLQVSEGPLPLGGHVATDATKFVNNLTTLATGHCGN